MKERYGLYWDDIDTDDKAIIKKLSEEEMEFNGGAGMNKMRDVYNI